MGDEERKGVGILAYGSIVSDPGPEIERLEVGRMGSVETPFAVEFVRSSSTRAGGPALAPVGTGGARVGAVIILLSTSVTVVEGFDLVYRRETRTIGSGFSYRRRSGVNIECLEGFHGVEAVLYAALEPNLENPTPRQLARLAIDSARSETGRKRLDGISYLIDVKANGVMTPLMGPYEREVLRQTGAVSLDEAWARCRQSG